jgi:hypothetical protein
MKFRPAPAPVLPHEPHAFKLGRMDGVWTCTSCPLPRANRIHDPQAVAELEAKRRAKAAEWAEFDAAVLGEREHADA